MAKKQLSDIEMMEIRRIAMERAQLNERIRKEAKPSLLTRYFSAIVDFLITAALVILLMTFLASPYLNATKYNEYRNQAIEYLKTTDLYSVGTDGNVYTYTYDDINLDEVITNYYSTKEYPISKDMLSRYNKDKLDSELYEKVGDNYILVSDYDEEELRRFLTIQYNTAISFAKDHPDYATASNKSFIIFATGVAFLIVLSTSLFYLIIPLCRREGETLAQMMFKLCIIDTTRLQQVSKKQIALRFFFVVFFNYYIPGVIYLVGGSFIMALPILITTIVMGVDKNNRSIHDFMSNTMVICKHRTNAEKVFQSIVGTDQIDRMGRM